MEKKKMSRSQWLIPLLILTIAAIALALFVIAKYTGTADVESEANLQGFNVAPVVVGTVGTDYESWDSDTGVVLLTVSQYQNFALNVEKAGYGWAYARVSVEESWRIRNTDTDTETVVATTGSVLQWDGSLLDSLDTTNDENKYVDEMLTDPDTISIFAGSNTPATYSGTLNSNEELVVRLSIKVEAIQYNRVDTFWAYNPF